MATRHEEIVREGLSNESVFSSLQDGVYITDTDRRIIYWSDSAERITGWNREDVLGKCCRDNILCHVDKDGRSLCGKEHCPLHRTIVTGNPSVLPIIVFAKGQDGNRIPMHVSTAPLRGASGDVIGGIEVFRDMSHAMHDLQRAKAIQESAMRLEVAPDKNFRVQAHYVPHDIVGGDFYSIEDVGLDGISILLADVMGHGTASALYSMYFAMLWRDLEDSRRLPARMLTAIDQKLHPLVVDTSSFATAASVYVDKKRGVLKYSGAGHPPLLLYRQDGSVQELDCSALPLGLLGEGVYEEHEVPFNPGDGVLLYTDGAVEIEAKNGEELGVSGLKEIAQKSLSTRGFIQPRMLEAGLLKESNCVRYADDVTIIWMTRT